MSVYLYSDTLNTPPRGSSEKAREMADILMKKNEVKAVWEFGSVARHGVGEDVDLIVIVDKDIALDEKRRSELHDILYGNADIEQMRCPVHIFVLWPNWQNDLDEVKRRLPHPDQDFWRCVARDARPISTKRLASR